MSTEPKNADPYDAVLRDLRAKREEIDGLIRSIERVRGLPSAGKPPLEKIADLASADSSVPHDEGAFFGMTIPEAAKKLLRMRRRHMTTPEITEGLASGGLVLGSADPTNTIGSVLRRHENEGGGIVRISPGRGGKWGLAEWTPHLRKKKAADDPGALDLAPVDDDDDED